MDHYNKNSNNVDTILAGLAEQQRRALRKKLIIGFSELLIIGLILYFAISSPTSYRSRGETQLHFIESLEITEVRNHFQQKNDAMLVEVPAFNRTVSITSEEEYC